MLSNRNQRQSIKAFAKDLENEIKKRVPKDTGKLKNSIKAVTDDNGFHVDMLPYGILIDQGVNGKKKNRGSGFSFTNKMPPIESLRGWAKRKGLNEYAVQKSIFRNGLKPTYFIDKAMVNNIDDFADDFTESIWDDFADDIDSIWDN